MSDYTHTYAARDRLKNGTAVIVRAIEADDKEQLQQIMRGVSAESRYYRFLAAKKSLSERELQYFTEIDFDSHIGLIVSLCDDSETPIAVGRYIRLSEGDGAEMALLVGEDYQGQGIGRMLLDHLVHIALTKGVSQFVCYIMSENRKMLNLLRESPFPVSQAVDTSSIVRLCLDIRHRRRSA